jgi:hypothetical protein
VQTLVSICGYVVDWSHGVRIRPDSSAAQGTGEFIGDGDASVCASSCSIGLLLGWLEPD